MPISFNQIPSNIKVPLYWVEVDPSKAGLPQLGLRALLVGTMITTGDGEADVPIAVGSQAQADAHFGQGSELSRMFRAYYANNLANEVWGLPVKEPTAGTAATGTITVTTPPTEAGTIHLYIAGDHVPVNVGATDTVNDVHVAISAAINEMFDLPVSSTGAPTDVTLTALFKGVNGNEITVSLNYYGSIGGERLPTGLTLTLPVGGVLAGGVGTPSFTQAISNMGEQEFEYIAMPYTDSNSLFDWDQEFGFTDGGRWGWMRQHFGHVFSAKRGTYPDLLTFGATQNSGVISVMGFEISSPSPAFEWTAAYTGKAHRSLSIDPARPLQTLPLNQIKSAPLHQRFDFDELNSMATTGIAIQKTGSDNQPFIAREQTL